MADVEKYTVRVAKPFRLYVESPSGRTTEIRVSQTELDRNTPEQLEDLLGHRLLCALLDLGIAHRTNIEPASGRRDTPRELSQPPHNADL